jgi:hypothetical protein
MYLKYSYLYIIISDSSLKTNTPLSAPTTELDLSKHTGSTVQHELQTGRGMGAGEWLAET